MPVWIILQIVIPGDETRMSSTPSAATDPDAGSRSQAPRWAWLTATFFGTGKLRPGPGSWASALTVVVWWAISRGIPVQWHVAVVILLAVLVIVAGIPAATRVSRQTGVKDPSFVVIDEVAGQLVALIALPVHWKTLLLGFILFRAFDIVKPPPLRRLEHIPEGAGIMLDDVGAGLYALIVGQLLLHFGWVR